VAIVVAAAQVLDGAGEPAVTEIGHGWFGKGPSERDLSQGHLVGGLLHVTDGSAGARG
jgi:hypothetical protein